MPTIIRDDALAGSGSTIPVDGYVSNPATDSSARKYTATGNIDFYPKSPASSNITSIVDVAAGLKMSAIALEGITSIARNDVASARQLALNPGSTSPGNITTNDANAEQNRIINSSAPAVLSSIADITGSIESGVMRNRMLSVVDRLIKKSRDHAFPVEPGEKKINSENKAVPDLESVELRTRAGRGVGDIFYSSMDISIPSAFIDSGDVKVLRVFRSELISPNLVRQPDSLSMTGIGRLLSNKASVSALNQDQLSQLEHTLADSNIKNDLSRYFAVDRFLNVRTKSNPSGIDIGGADRSIVGSPSFVDAVRVQDNRFGQVSFDNSLTFGKNVSDGMKPAQVIDIDSRSGDPGPTIEGNNEVGFKEIFSSTPDKIRSKKIGDRYHYYIDDETVVFGRQYKYYVLTVDRKMVQSRRSVIVTLSVDGIRVPSRPKNVRWSVDTRSITLSMVVDDRFVERYEIWKKSSRLRNDQFNVVELPNQFRFVEESPASENGGVSSWIDKFVCPGDRIVYRVYSVDIFGNKSESPVEVSIDVPDINDEFDVSLARPSVLAEVDAQTKKIKLTMRCDDRNVKYLRVERRDLSIGQQNFVDPSNVQRMYFGLYSLKHSSFVGTERIQDRSPGDLWNGQFVNTGQEIIFIDRLVAFDRTYQYRIHGISALGRRTSYDYSSPVMVFRKPMINVPANLATELSTSLDGQIIGVNISWQSSSLDVSPEDKVGSQRVLANTSVRSLYQLQRAEAGSQRWQSFNMTTAQSYFDPVVGYQGDISPEYRPPFLELNKSYVYRIQAVLSGGYISNVSKQSQVFVGYEVATPKNFDLVSTDARTRPFYVMLNWDTDELSGIVDHWDIERCEINNFAAARMNLRNPDELKKLKFKQHRQVFRESSRFRSVWADMTFAKPTNPLISGQHHFQDARVSMGNTYVYRIYAVDPVGLRSIPAYRAIKITYSSFENLLSNTVSADEKRALVELGVPMRPHPAIATEQPTDSAAWVPGYTNVYPSQPQPSMPITLNRISSGTLSVVPVPQELTQRETTTTTIISRGASKFRSTDV